MRYTLIYFEVNVKKMQELRLSELVLPLTSLHRASLCVAQADLKFKDFTQFSLLSAEITETHHYSQSFKFYVNLAKLQVAVETYFKMVDKSPNTGEMLISEQLQIQTSLILITLEWSLFLLKRHFQDIHTITQAKERYLL